ncbi:MAG: IclR family transcriptional regulator [Lautropia sp. SCN 70-15]|nr:MAG: IclR family transcriptional regulator [Lautropia sp. SCN 70-15]
MSVLVPAAARTMAVFEAFAHEKRELSNSEIARQLGIPESSCSDLLQTLLDTGYVMRTVRSKRFYPTGRLLILAREIADNDPIRAVAREATELLSEKTGESALFGRLELGYVKILAIQEARHHLRYVMKVGDKIAVHASGMGKALLAVVPSDEAARQLRLKPLRKLTPTTIVDMAELERQAHRARERGWAEAEGEGTEGVTALGVAGYIGGEPFALSITGPTERFRKSRDAYLESLLEVKKQIFRDAAP